MAITLSPTTILNGILDVTYTNQTISASGGSAPYTYSVSAGSLPTGLSLNPNTGEITGTPITAGGQYSFDITATDSILNTGSQSYTVYILVVSQLLPNACVGDFYDNIIGNFGEAYYNPPYTSLVFSGTIPPNFVWVGTGLSGSTMGEMASLSTTIVGTYTFVIQITDNGGQIYYLPCTVTINPIPTISPSSLPNGVIGNIYNQTISVSGTPPDTFTITSGSLPTGLSLNGSTGVISGTPSSVGTYNFTITASNVNGCPNSQSYTVIISSVVSKRKRKSSAFAFPPSFCVKRNSDAVGKLIDCPQEVLYPNQYGRIYTKYFQDEQQCCYQLKNNSTSV